MTASPPPGSPLDRLSPSERDIVRLAVQGLTNRQIAFETDRADSTVRVHVARGVPEARRDRPRRPRRKGGGPGASAGGAVTESSTS